jgi:hypothetical protein
VCLIIVPRQGWRRQRVARWPLPELGEKALDGDRVAWFRKLLLLALAEGDSFRHEDCISSPA